MLTTWLERIRDFRNRKVADPAFRRWAGRFFLTRPIARRQAKSLFDLTAGFVYSQVLSACVKVDLFEMLAARSLAIEEIASRIGLPPEGTERLLKAAASLDLVEARRGGKYALGALGAALVGNPGVKAIILHHDLLYGDLRDPLALLAGRTKTELNHYWVYAAGASAKKSEPPQHADYSGLMSASQAFVADEILDAYRFDRHRYLLDVGGGDATFLIAAGKAAAHLDLALFDLPAVAAIARQRIFAAGLAGRAKAYGGNFLVDDLPKTADLVILNRVLHDHDDAAVLKILKAIRAAIASNGTVLIAEPMAGTGGAKASGDAYFGFYLLAMGQGRPRTIEEYSSMLVHAGFASPREIATNTPLIARILTARTEAGATEL